MDSLPYIPTPVSQRWREFRIRVMPVFFFAVLAITVAALWRQVAIPPTFAVGFVETNGATVSVPLDGQLAQMAVRRFQQVKQGDQLCQLVVKPTNILSAEIDVLKADIDKIKITMTPLIDEERARLAYFQLRLDLMKERGAQATDQVRLKQAIEDYRSAWVMLTNNPPAIATNQFEKIKTDMEALQATVNAREQTLARLEQDLTTSALTNITVVVSNTTGGSNTPTPIGVAIAVVDAKIKELETTYAPIPLVSPIDGMIMMVNRRSGEYLRAGEPVLFISAMQSEQIVGYVRQPMSIHPKVGMPVEVRARTAKRETAVAKVTQVGAQMEPFSTAMIPNAANTRLVEFGLPITVTLPPAMALIPGELVDLILEPK
jgi:multidrug resistance efflux pump